MNEYILKCCCFCNNAVVDPRLTPDNDLSYCPVGKVADGYGLLFRSGDDRPTALVLEMWDKRLNRNLDIGLYVMKYCPECGRKLIENKH